MNTRSNLLKLTLSATLAVATLVGAGTASASDNVVARSKVVKYDDLNLSTQAGVERLYTRIRSAARTVCGPTYGASLATAPATSARRRRCMDDAIASAVKQVDNTILTAMHNSKSTKRRYG